MNKCVGGRAETNFIRSLEHARAKTRSVFALSLVILLIICTFSVSPVSAHDKVAKPTFSPVSGTYSSPQSVTINCTTEGATIRYTTNGSTPSILSTVYDGPIPVNVTTTIKAKAFKSGMATSDTASATYTIKLAKIAKPTFNPAEGTYSSTQNVAISCATSGATITYTTDDSEPSPSSTKYSNPILVSANMTVKAKAFMNGMADSDTASATYTISTPAKVATPTFSPSGGTYSSSQSVTLSCSTSGASMRYTIDGSEPSSSSTLYSSPIPISSTTTIKAKAFKNDMTDSDMATATYTITSQEPQPSKVSTPTFSPAGGTYSSSQTVVLGCATPDATIRFTVDGSEPSSSSALYSSPISVSASTTIKAKAFVSGITNSNTASAAYIIILPKVETPTFSPMAGSYSGAQSVIIRCVTSGAIIRYTTNGAEPSSTSTVYSGPIAVSVTTTVKAKAFMFSGMTNSDTASATYTISTGISPQETLIGNAMTYAAIILIAIDVVLGGRLVFLSRRKKQ